MYAVIKTGGKQERVAEGQKLRVELLGEHTRHDRAVVRRDMGTTRQRADRLGQPVTTRVAQRLSSS